LRFFAGLRFAALRFFGACFFLAAFFFFAIGSITSLVLLGCKFENVLLTSFSNLFCSIEHCNQLQILKSFVAWRDALNDADSIIGK
jgi:hypothetical protein